MDRQLGICKFWSHSKGFGFIVLSDNREEKDKKYYSDNNKPNNEKHKVKKMTYLCTRIASILIAYCIVNFLND